MKLTKTEEKLLKMTGTNRDEAGVIMAFTVPERKAVLTLSLKGLVTIAKDEIVSSRRMKRYEWGREWQMSRSVDNVDLRFKLTDEGEEFVKEVYGLVPNRDPWVEKHGKMVHVSTLTPKEQEYLGWELRGRKWVKSEDYE